MGLQDLEEEQKDISEVCHNEHDIICYHNYDHVVSISLFAFFPPSLSSSPLSFSASSASAPSPLSYLQRLVIKGHSSNYSASSAAKNEV